MLLAMSFRLFLASLIRLLVGTTWPVAKLTQPGTKLTLPVSKLTLLVTKLRIAARFGSATLTQIRRHDPPVRALRGTLAAGRFTLFVLGHSGTCKTTEGKEYRNGEEYLDHVPTLRNVLPGGHG